MKALLPEGTCFIQIAGWLRLLALPSACLIY